MGGAGDARAVRLMSSRGFNSVAEPRTARLMLVEAGGPCGGWDGLRMRNERVQPCPPADAVPRFSCPACHHDLEPGGILDAWIFLVCGRCELVWRITPGDLARAITDPATLPEAC
jgi:hypothetical protein